MRTRRDQVQAYRFVTRRIVSAMVSGEPETNDLPMRRLGLALVGSVLVGALVLAGFGVYGLLTENRAPLQNQTLVIDKDSGAKFVYVRDRLYPVPNYASARLILNTDTPEIRRVSSGSLKNLPRGRMVGIIGAPDALPDAKSMTGSTWRICSNRTPGQGNIPVTSMVVGQTPAGAQQLGTSALLTQTPDRIYHLLWNGRSLKVPSLEKALLAGKPSVQVTQQVIDSIPAGPDLKVPNMAGLGETFDRPVDGTPAKIGTVYRVGNQRYVLTQNGMAPIGRLTAEILEANGSAPRDTTASIAESLASKTAVEPEGFPEQMPQLIDVGDTNNPPGLCSLYEVSTGVTSIEVYPRVPGLLAADLEVGEQDTSSPNALVDRVLLAGGQGALVQRALPGGKTAPGDTVYLLTDGGRKYPLGTDKGDAKAALGYGAVTPIAVPSPILALIDEGPLLDVDVADDYLDAESAAPAAPGQ